MEILTKAFESTQVSCKLLMFHVTFLSLVKRKTLQEMAAEADMFYGKPSQRVTTKFQNQMKKILSCSSWPEFFTIIQVKCPSPEYMTNWWKDSFANSKRKKYHSETTNFSAIQRSGVSKILLKGESYSASPTLKKVFMEEVWGFEDGTIYLDASCLIYDFNNQLVATVDYSHTTYAEAVVHSGDIIDPAKKSGKHTITIHLNKLGANIKSLFFTMSAWTTLLSAIKQPSVYFVDADLQQELCGYNFDAKDTADKTAIVMCMLQRKDPNSSWTVTAIGELGYGRAGTYAPIEAEIKKVLR